MFDCINRALELKDAITRFSENDMELDGQIDGEDDEIRQMGKLAESSKKWCAQHIPILCCSFIYIYIAKVCVFLVFAVLHIAGVWPYFHP